MVDAVKQRFVCSEGARLKLKGMLELAGSALPDVDAIIGNNEVEINGLNLCDRSSATDAVLSYAMSSKYVGAVKDASHVVALFVKKEDAANYESCIIARGGCLLITSQPEIAFYLLHEALCSYGEFYENRSFPAQIGNDCDIAPTAVIESGVVIGDHVTIGHNTVVRAGSVLDDYVVIGCNSTIGSEGFQLITNNLKMPMRITHVGGCHLCQGAFVGDNASVCKSLFEGETVIGIGARIDNQSHIAHNSYVGANAVITAGVVTCGSVRIEGDAWIAPGALILNRVTIGAGAMVGMGSVVTRNVPPRATVYGNPARVH